MDKDVIGLVENIEIMGRKNIKAKALFDTGAHRTSVDVRLASRAELGPIIKTTLVRNPGSTREVRRPIVEATIKINGVEFKTDVNIQDRSHMTFPVIIGRNIISGNFVVDPKKNLEIYKKFREEKDKEVEFID
ncbi:MAG: ATP-dependent zinc protease [Deltaproteobacteria bacterium]|nr:ATP-dependent zinc protease [Deltaproteobacteria bacterium]